MDLGKAHLPFSGRYYCYRGFSFQAQLLSLSLDVSNVYFNYPRRLLKMEAKVPLRPGDQIRGQSGKRYLVGEHGPSELNDVVLYKTYKLFEVTHPAALWSAQGTTTDPILGIKVASGNPAENLIPVAIEFQKSQEDEMRIQADLVRIITNAAVQIDDHIDSYTILNVEPQLGLNFCLARRL